MPRGVLLYGAPGVGKTVMAKSIATEGIACVELRSADCTREDSEDYILSAFEEAREKAPCVLLIDELDKIAESNEHYYMEGNDRALFVIQTIIVFLFHYQLQNVATYAFCNKKI